MRKNKLDSYNKSVMVEHRDKIHVFANLLQFYGFDINGKYGLYNKDSNFNISITHSVKQENLLTKLLEKANSKEKAFSGKFIKSTSMGKSIYVRYEYVGVGYSKNVKVDKLRNDIHLLEDIIFKTGDFKEEEEMKA